MITHMLKAIYNKEIQQDLLSHLNVGIAFYILTTIYRVYVEGIDPVIKIQTFDKVLYIEI